MTQAARSKGIDKYAQRILRDKEAREQRLCEERTITEKIARLRALRLAKAAAEKKVVKRASAATPTLQRPNTVAKVEATPASAEGNVRSP